MLYTFVSRDPFLASRDFVKHHRVSYWMKIMKCLTVCVFLACLACCYPSSIINRKDPSKPPSPSAPEEVSNSTIIIEEEDLEESNVNGTDRMHSYFPNHPYPGQGLGGGGGPLPNFPSIPNVPPFGNILPPQWGGQSCRQWCQSYGRGLECCDGNLQRIPQCPGERAVCPLPNRSFGVPRLCNTHGECYQYRELCCYDVCVRQRVCKQPE